MQHQRGLGSLASCASQLGPMVQAKEAASQAGEGGGCAQCGAHRFDFSCACNEACTGALSTVLWRPSVPWFRTELTSTLRALRGSRKSIKGQ